MKYAEEKKQHQTPTKSATKIYASLYSMIHLQKETQAKQKGEYHKKLTRKNMLSKPSVYVAHGIHAGSG